jgi:hypothetical protein
MTYPDMAAIGNEVLALRDVTDTKCRLKSVESGLTETPRLVQNLKATGKTQTQVL